MCVPVCIPMDIFETFAASPRSRSRNREIMTGGLSGQWTMPSLNPTETSIHFDEVPRIVLSFAILQY